MYIDNKKLTKELGIWAEKVRDDIKNDRKKTPMTDYIGECVYLICNNMGYMPRFINYSFKDEMIGDAIENCIKYAKNFDGNRFNNAFAYLSKISYQAYVRRINISKKKYNDHLNYIRNSVNVEDFKDAINADNPNDIKGYRMYIDYLVDMIDIMDIEMPEKKKKTKKNKESILEKYMVEDFE